MNNTKWREVFQVLVSSRVGGLKCKCRNEEELRERGVALIADELWVEGARWPSVLYKQIDLLFIPAKYEVSRGDGLVPWIRTNDLDAIEAELNSIGLLEFEKSRAGITLFGYSKR